VLIHLNHYLDQSDLLRALDLESGVNARLRILYWVTGLVSLVAVVSWIVVLAVNMDIIHYNIMISVYYGFEAVLLIFTTVRLNMKMSKIEDEVSSARRKFMMYQIILCLLVTLNFFWVLFIPDIREALTKDKSFVGTTFLLWLNLVFELPILLVVCFSH
jgi:cytochrome c biogenesis factor